MEKPITFYDVEGVRKTFDRFQIEAIKTAYTIGVTNDSRHERGETLVSNCETAK